MNQVLHEAQTVRFERLLPGPIERVWDYITRPDLQWVWLGEAAAELAGAARYGPHRSVAFTLPDASTVSMELEPCGSEVKLVLTHRRVPAWLAGAATVIAVALLMFCFPPSEGRGQSPTLKLPSSLKLPSFGSQRVYGMLGGRC